MKGMKIPKGGNQNPVEFMLLDLQFYVYVL
jgi:hypothetical protein